MYFYKSGWEILMFSIRSMNNLEGICFLKNGIVILVFIWVILVVKVKGLRRYKVYFKNVGRCLYNVVNLRFF